MCRSEIPRPRCISLNCFNSLANYVSLSGTFLSGTPAGVPLMMAGVAIKIISGVVATFIDTAPGDPDDKASGNPDDQLQVAIFAKLTGFGNNLDKVADSVRRVERKLGKIEAKLDEVLKKSSEILHAISLQAEERFFDLAGTMHYDFLRLIDHQNGKGLRTYLNQQMPSFIQNMNEVFSPVHQRWHDHLKELLKEQSGKSVLERIDRLLVARIAAFDLALYYYLVVLQDEDMAVNHLERFGTDFQLLRDAKNTTVVKGCLKAMWTNPGRLSSEQILVSKDAAEELGTIMQQAYRQRGKDDEYKRLKDHFPWQGLPDINGSDDNTLRLEAEKIKVDVPALMRACAKAGKDYFVVDFDNKIKHPKSCMGCINRCMGYLKEKRGLGLDLMVKKVRSTYQESYLYFDSTWQRRQRSKENEFALSDEVAKKVMTKFEEAMHGLESDVVREIEKVEATFINETCRE
eukprot:TRINITY_DN48088_c0_g1_i2.p1 TRINITY_DN48088_c0_g1~~TRINITY_DN48088_c0_g1_i2.p1  ORF type:complete len:460 (+),score=81.85 TRINITY_DN48088_c0_g1_i2:79-1458(+)